MNKLSRLKSLIFVPVMLGGGLMLAATAQAYTMDVANTQFYSGANYVSNGQPVSASFSSLLYEQLSNALGSYTYTGKGFGYINGYAPTVNGLVPTAYNSSGSYTTPSWCLSSDCVLTLTFDFTPTSSTTAQGTVSVYANNTGVFDPNNSSTLTQANAANGELLLNLTSIAPFTSIVNTSTGQLTFGGGFKAINTTGALNYLFMGPNSNTFFFASGNTNYGNTLPSTCPSTTGSYCYQIGNGTGSYFAVPEPGDLGMMGLGLLMVGMLGLRMRQSRFRRD